MPCLVQPSSPSFLYGLRVSIVSTFSRILWRIILAQLKDNLDRRVSVVQHMRSGLFASHV